MSLDERRGTQASLCNIREASRELVVVYITRSFDGWCCTDLIHIGFLSVGFFFIMASSSSVLMFNMRVG